MSGLDMQRRGVWAADRARRGESTRVRVGDRVHRLSNGKAVGTVVELAASGPGFRVLLDEPTDKQWDKSRGIVEYEGLAEANLYTAMGAQAGYGGRRSHGLSDEGLRLADGEAVEHRVMVAEVLWDDELRAQRALFG
jgi:hypothetical protein